jgi:hypothetical protein
MLKSNNTGCYTKYELPQKNAKSNAACEWVTKNRMKTQSLRKNGPKAIENASEGRSSNQQKKIGQLRKGIPSLENN